MLVAWSSVLAPVAGAAVEAAARRLRVGAQHELRSIAAAARVARDGDTIEIEAGTYEGDVAVWTQDRLTVRAVGGPVRLHAAGAHAEGKGIWVVRAGRMLVEGLEFSGARVPHQNGAGIKFEGGQLTVRNCRFIDNQMGILTAGAGLSLDVVSCEFGHSAPSERFNHQLYAGALDSLRVTACHFHHGRHGHLLKSRARRSLVRYCRLTDEADGQASYEIEFPNGGEAVVLGNLIQQSAATGNPCMVSYGVEGLASSTRHGLWLSHNTLVDGASHAQPLFRFEPGVRTALANNLIASDMSDMSDRPALAALDGIQWFNNHRVAAAVFSDAPAGDFRVLPAWREALAARPFEGGREDGVDLQPRFQYRHPMGLQALAGDPVLAGALQA